MAADDYAGSTVCKTCHADVWFNFYKNPHYKSIASGDQPPERTGCEGCHGPGKAHVEARGGKTTIPRAFSLMAPKAVLDTCLNCHAGDSSAPSTHWRTWCAPTVTPFTNLRPRNFCWLRDRPSYATGATRMCARSSPCPSSTA